MHGLNKIFTLVRKNGPRKSILIFLRVIFKLPPNGEINYAKKKANQIIENNYGKYIAFGPFAGMNYEQRWWARRRSARAPSRGGGGG